MAESGFPDFDTREWYGIVAPARTPREIIAGVADEIAKVVASQDVKDRLVAAGMDLDAQRGPMHSTNSYDRRQRGGQVWCGMRG